VVAGLGNIYVCECLHRARISPRRLALACVGGRAERLATAIRAVLEEAIAAGGSSLRDHLRPSGELGYFQHRWAVYGREGEVCRQCAARGRAGKVRRIVQSGRSSFFCPVCQR
jgi:formamidopyrimidine-DNA glycosylase